jgi:imidazolonepropionase-like amidohydrolase
MRSCSPSPARAIPIPASWGVIEEGALADLPLIDISLIADPEKNFRIIMKGGRIYKNTL